MKSLSWSASALALLCAVGKTTSFQAPLLSTTRTESTTLAVAGGKKEINPWSYGEQSRAYRRDFYTHDSWLKARAKNRFVGTLTKITQSGVVRQLVNEVLLVGAVATTVVLWNCLFVTGYEDFSLVHHEPIISPATFPLVKLPLEPFSLSSPALSLLLGKSPVTIRQICTICSHY
jgi:hypothetical protein